VCASVSANVFRIEITDVMCAYVSSSDLKKQVKAFCVLLYQRMFSVKILQTSSVFASDFRRKVAIAMCVLASAIA
jgi:hypothetical protein